MKKGIWYAVGAYLSWGLLPIYWKLLHLVPAFQLLGHRIVWSFVTLLIILAVFYYRKLFRPTAISFRVLRYYIAASILIGINWLTYVWAINTDHLVETSLGYFINPLLTVLLSVLFMRERLRPKQWIPIGLVASGVLYLTFVFGQLPWIALLLAFSFGFYGLVKKIAPLNSLEGLTLETGILFLPAVFYLIYTNSVGNGTFLHLGVASDLVIVGAGIVTTMPLLMFTSAARRIPLSLVGILQYISPTLHFLLGVFFYKESFTQVQCIGYVIVWLGLVLFGIESFFASRSQVAIMEPD